MITATHPVHVSTTDVLIAGGGPTGLTIAIVLRRYGIDCRVIDLAPEFHVHSRGKGVQPRTSEVFDDLGIVAEIRAHAMTSGAIRFYMNKQLVADAPIREPAPRPGIPYPGVRFIPQWQTERILRERLEGFGMTLERGRELVAFRDTGAGVIATVKEVATGALEEIHAAYLVGADGGRSVVRRELGLSFEGHNTEQFWVLGDMEIEGLGTSRDVAHAWFADDNSYLSISPLAGTIAFQVQASVEPNEAGEVEPASLELFQRLLEERTGLSHVRLSNPTWLSNHNVKERMVERYRKGRVFVAGDAAHIHSPAGGQGLNTGVQDAYNLGWKLALVLRGKAGDALLDTYDEERRPIAQHVLSLSGTGNSAFFSTNPIVSLLRRFVLLPLLEVPQVTDALLLRTAQLELNYRGTSLARNYVPDDMGIGDQVATWHALEGGDRAPDARVRDAATGAPTRFFDLFRGPHWTLLLFAGARATSATYDHLAAIGWQVEHLYGTDVQAYIVAPTHERPAGLTGSRMVLDPRREAYKLYGTRRGGLYLIRPDGYIGFRSPRPVPEPLIAYLGQIFSAPSPTTIKVGHAYSLLPAD